MALTVVMLELYVVNLDIHQVMSTNEMRLFNFIWIFYCYSSAYTYYSNAYYGQGTDPIWLDDLGCSGSELTLLQCSHNGLGSHNCYHYEDVSVRCSGSKTGLLLN